MRCAIVVEKGPTSYGGYVPDLPGCVATGESRDEVLREAIPTTMDHNLLAIGFKSPFTADDESRAQKSRLARPVQNRRPGPSRHLRPGRRRYQADNQRQHR